MNKKTRFIIGFIVAIFAFYYTIQNLSIDELFNSIFKIESQYLIYTVLLMGICYVPRAFRWQLLLSPIKSVNTSGLFSPMMIGFMGNFLPGRLGEPLRAYLFGKKYDVSIISSFATVVVERLFDLVVVIMLFVWILVFQSDVIDPNVYFFGISIQNIAVNFGLVALTIIFATTLFIYLLIHKKEKAIGTIYYFTQMLPNKWQTMIVDLVKKFSLGLVALSDFNCFMKMVIYTIFIWIITISAFIPLTLAFDIQEKTITLLVLLRAMVSILIVILPTPAYLGSFNAGVFIVLHEIMGETEIVAASFGLVAWALNTFVVFFSGMCFLSSDWLLEKSFNKIDKDHF